MLKKQSLLSMVVVLFLMTNLISAKEYKLESPNKNIEVKINVGKKIKYSVFCNLKEIIKQSPISLTISDSTVLGDNARVVDVQKKSFKETIHPVVKRKSEKISNNCNEIRFICEGNYALVFRVYDNAVAYRFETNLSEDIKILTEEVSFNLAPEDTVYFPREDRLMSHNERSYEVLPLKEIQPESFCSLPVLVKTQSDIWVLVTEADLYDYPGLWLKVNSASTFSGLLPAVALEVKAENDRNIYVTKRADYLAETDGSRTYPWRVMAIAENEADLLTNEIVYLLSRPLELEDTSWIKPGKVAWDWWNALNIYGVDFKSGVNTETYKYYIDFAAQYGIEYIILDEGWYKLGDVLDVVPELDIEEIMAYGKKKNVGIILWVIWKTLDDQLEAALDQYEKWGAKGIKVDFMQRDDQEVVNYYWKVAREAAKRKMLVDYHGSYKPAGLRRAYPNVITREGVTGFEHNKWSEDITPEHNVTLPFIRMVAGPMDYTPGAMINAQKNNFRVVFTRPMSKTTRCHQLAIYVIYESPLQMLADNPSNYLKEPVCMEFLSAVPTVWDETVVLAAKVADYVVIARRHGKDWYVGAMTDGTPRQFEIGFSFLGSGKYKMDSYQDGINADKYASDFKKVTSEISQEQKVKIKLAASGGWAARIYKK